MHGGVKLRSVQPFATTVGKVCKRASDDDDGRVALMATCEGDDVSCMRAGNIERIIVAIGEDIGKLAP